MTKERIDYIGFYINSDFLHDLRKMLKYLADRASPELMRKLFSTEEIRKRTNNKWKLTQGPLFEQRELLNKLDKYMAEQRVKIHARNVGYIKPFDVNPRIKNKYNSFA